MKHTIAQNKQLFNVKAIADSKTLDNLAEGEFGVFAEGSNTSLAASATYSSLPDKFRLFAKVGGKMYYSFDTIEKSSMRNFMTQEYQAEQINIWETVIEHCDCIESALVKIGIDEDGLLRQNGLTWTDIDQKFVEPLSCTCSCSGDKVYDNHLMTMEVAKKINDTESPYYLAKVKVDLTDVDTYADQGALNTAVPSPDAGDEAIITGTGFVQYNGSTWETVGTEAGVLTDAETYVEVNKPLNTDGDPATDTTMLTLVVEGKPSKNPGYKDLDINHIFPRGVRLSPSIALNGDASCLKFTETQALEYELGAGSDMRLEEFESMNYYTDLNHLPQLHDGIATDKLVYQFENGKNYDTLNFEFYTDKVNKNDGDKRSFGVLLATDNPTIFSKLENLFSA